MQFHDCQLSMWWSNIMGSTLPSFLFHPLFVFFTFLINILPNWLGLSQIQAGRHYKTNTTSICCFLIFNYIFYLCVGFITLSKSFSHKINITLKLDNRTFANLWITRIAICIFITFFFNSFFFFFFFSFHFFCLFSFSFFQFGHRRHKMVVIWISRIYCFWRKKIFCGRKRKWKKEKI